jgi:hypothetical protein
MDRKIDVKCEGAGFIAVADSGRPLRGETWAGKTWKIKTWKMMLRNHAGAMTRVAEFIAAEAG